MRFDGRFTVRKNFVVTLRVVRKKTDKRDRKIGENVVKKTAPRRDYVWVLEELQKHVRKADHEAFAESEKVAVKSDRKHGRKRYRSAGRHFIKPYERERERGGETYRAVSEFARAGRTDDTFFTLVYGVGDSRRRADRDNDHEQQYDLPPFGGDSRKVKHCYNSFDTVKIKTVRTCLQNKCTDVHRIEIIYDGFPTRVLTHRFKGTARKHLSRLTSAPLPVSDKLYHRPPVMSSKRV